MTIETLNDAVNPKGAIVMTHPTRTQIALSQKPYLGKKERKVYARELGNREKTRKKTKKRKEKEKKELIFIHRVSCLLQFCRKNKPLIFSLNTYQLVDNSVTTNMNPVMTYRAAKIFFFKTMLLLSITFNFTNIGNVINITNAKEQGIKNK